MKTRILCLMSVAVLCSSFSSGGTNPSDVLHLKDGSTVRGTIIEVIPDSTVTIRMSDGSVRVYAMTIVENIEREPVPGTESVAITDSLSPPFSFVYYGGVSIPREDFASTAGDRSAAAETGFGLGVDARYAFTPSLSWMGSLNLSFNGMVPNALLRGSDATVSTDSWIIFCILNGLKLTGTVSPGVDMFLFGQVGVLYATIPKIIITSSTQRLSQSAGTASSLAYGYGAGIAISHFELCFRYFTGEPEYNISVSGGGVSAAGSFKQPVSCVFITGGYRF